MELLAMFLEFAQAAGPVAVAALWQGSVLALALALCLRLMPRASAADRFRAWAAGFAALTALPFFPLLNSIHWSAAGGSLAVGADAAAHAWAGRPWLQIDVRWGLAIAAAWLAASVWRGADLAVHGLRLRRLWKSAKAIDFPGAPVPVCATHELDQPSVIGFLRPRILVPDWLLERMTADELGPVVLHEAEHLRRRDDWANLLQKLALVVFPLNPALAWMERRLCREREMACDDAVVRATGQPRAYAACLASLAERGLERKLGRREALSLGAWRQRPELVGRVHRILKHAPALSPAAARALLGLVACGLVFSCAELARSPQLVAFATPANWAQATGPDLVNAGLSMGGQPMGNFHEVEAVVHMPERAAKFYAPAAESGGNPAGGDSLIAKTAAPQARSNSRHRSVGTVNTAPRPTLVAGRGFNRAATNAQKSAALGSAALAPEGPRQWVVFTAWEQVVTVSPKSFVAADYDLNPAPESKEQDGAVPNADRQQLVRQWTVTRLVFRVDSRSDRARPVSGGAVTRNQDLDSQPALLTTFPLEEGWLVFQL